MSQHAFDPVARIAEQLTARIRTEGPLPISVFMLEALFDPVAGFYATRDPIGAGADFITAPEISQMFGEVLGLWTVQAWRDLGAPAEFHMVELGPGKGTMMSDVIRSLGVAPEARHAVRVSLIEASAALKMVQGQTLANSPVPVSWAKSIEHLPDGPAVLLANEFLDCLPLRQAVKADGRWRERCVGLDPEDETRFAFVLGAALAADEALIAPELREVPDGSLVELRPGDLQVAESLARRFAAQPGRALFIDYGPALPDVGDTLQALQAHRKVDPLTAPGTADLTARVDFAGFARACAERGLDVHGPAPQGEFLKTLGIEHRAAALMARAGDEPGKARIVRQLHRLTDPGEMGALFKVMCISSPDLPPPAGLEPWVDPAVD
ncbi:MAG: SAM-dependent methyltransferase [Pseudomonadota bacterium]